MYGLMQPSYMRRGMSCAGCWRTFPRNVMRLRKEGTATVGCTPQSPQFHHRCSHMHVSFCALAAYMASACGIDVIITLYVSIGPFDVSHLASSPAVCTCGSIYMTAIPIPLKTLALVQQRSACPDSAAARRDGSSHARPPPAALRQYL